jgi:hypothetical protein
MEKIVIKKKLKSIKLQIRIYNYVFERPGVNFKGMREKRKHFTAA